MTDDFADQIDEHIRVAGALRREINTLNAIAERIIGVIHDGGRVYVLGNGGSAADAQHIAAELLGRFKRDRRALPAMALTTDSSTLTAIANDMGGEEMFRRQVQGLVTPRDVVWALSVSGRSPNVIAALNSAREIGATVVGFTSRKGGAMAELCDLCLRVDSDAGDRVQECHELAYHMICDRIERAFA
ncbi:MAG: SIS domain-containing protein [Phycisphaerales bacterium]|nr:SIS domain-containing protein [Phycisphaerales bacterium]